MMSETGQGLIDDGREDEIAPDSDIANMWGRYCSIFVYPFRYLISVTDLIQKKFPWYKRMHALMGTNPIVDRSAIAHSRTTINLSSLSRDGTPAVCLSLRVFDLCHLYIELVIGSLGFSLVT